MILCIVIIIILIIWIFYDEHKINLLANSIEINKISKKRYDDELKIWMLALLFKKVDIYSENEKYYEDDKFYDNHDQPWYSRMEEFQEHLGNPKEFQSPLTKDEEGIYLKVFYDDYKKYIPYNLVKDIDVSGHPSKEIQDFVYLAKKLENKRSNKDEYIIDDLLRSLRFINRVLGNDNISEIRKIDKIKKEIIYYNKPNDIDK